MTQRSWSARLLRRSERLLDGTGPGPDPVGRLLDGVRRLPDGPVNGEDAALAHFRSHHVPLASADLANAAPLAAAAQPTLTLRRSNPVRTFTLRRLLAAKVLAIGVATVTLGGVAFAASLDVLKLPFQPASSTLVAGAGAASRSGAAASGAAAGADGASTGSSSDNDAVGGSHPAASGARSADPDRSASAGAGKTDAKRLTAALQVRQAVECQVWRWNGTGTVPAKVTADLTKAAGSSAAILSFCQKLTTGLCTRWPMVVAQGQAADVTKRRVVERCPFDLQHKVIVPKLPVPVPTLTARPLPGPVTKPWPPIATQPGPGPLGSL